MSDISHEALLRHIKELSQDGSTSEEAQKSLADAGLSALPHLIDLISGPGSEAARWRGVETLVRIGAPAVPSLIKLSRDNSPLVRRMAVDGLRMTGDPRALVPIQAAARDSSENVRAAAARALEELGAGHPQTPKLARLASDRFSDCFRVMSWYFFRDDYYTTLRSPDDKELIRELAALPISLLVWLPLAIPVLGMLFGVITLYRDWLGKLAILLAVPLGWLLTWLLGRLSFEYGDPTWYKRLGYGVLLIVTGFVVYSEMKFATYTVIQLGMQAGGIIVGTQLIALALAIGIGFNMGVNLPALIPGIAGAVVGFFAAESLPFNYVPIGAVVAGIGLGVAAALLPAFGVNRALNSANAIPVRRVVLGLVVVFNLFFVWLILLGGWEVIFQPYV